MSGINYERENPADLPMSLRGLSEPKPTDIVGYRQLSPLEISLINLVKSNQAALEDVIAAVRSHLKQQRYDAAVDEKPSLASMARIKERSRIEKAEPERWVAIARTHFQEGCMALTRAIAQPSI